MENIYPVLQLQPNHADHISNYKESWLNEMFEKEDVVAQRKYDGERMLIHFNGDEIYCTSRRHSKKTGRYIENQDKLLNMPKLDLNYTIVDCECYSNTWSDIAGILGSLPERAHELQKTIPVKFACFDCLYYDGKDVRNEPYIIRLNYVCNVLDKISDLRFHIAETEDVLTLKAALNYRDTLINNGYEGCVIKSLAKKYYDLGASIKAKRFETVDVVVIDYQQGKGKYANTIGSLMVGYYDANVEEKFVYISKVNCSTDAERNWWRDNWSTAQYSVIEVKCQEITKKSLRHPVYIRKRDDKDYTMVTRDTIFKDETTNK